MKHLTIAILIWLLFAGCETKPPASTPQQVAQTFWHAMKNGDRRMAKALTVRQRIDDAPPFRIELENVRAKGTRVIDGRAFVPTAVTFTIPIGKKASAECNATFDTELLKVQNRWLVDDIVTMENYKEGVEKGAIACGTKLLDETLREGVEAFEKFQKELGNESRKLQERWKKTMQIWRQEMLEALKGLQQELEKGPQKRDEHLPSPKKGERI
ncbi:hypothetical protein [Hydrogenimonas urashimensis]|uniref:hypothetical protein n=1 Tax=Hydrogenimonas urashimensis TaxID=2740515 RepID=UPI001915108B|nr:hypothetical protein [Hydrogenimonas urashimensis]